MKGKVSEWKILSSSFNNIKTGKRMYVKHEIVSKNACDAAYRRFYHIIVSRKLLIT